MTFGRKKLPQIRLAHTMLLDKNKTGVESPYWKYLRPIIILSNAAGCYCHPLRNEFVYRTSLRVYSSLVSVLLLYGICRCSAELFHGSLQWNSATLFKFFFLNYFMLCLMSHLFISFASCAIVRVLQAIKSDNENLSEKRPALKRITIFVFLSIIFKFIANYATIILCAFEIVHVTYLPDIIPGGPKYLLLIPTFFAQVRIFPFFCKNVFPKIFQTALGVAMGLFAMLCAILSTNLRSISTEMRHSSGKMIQSFQQRYQRLVGNISII
jgi:hypothetical protein